MLSETVVIEGEVSLVSQIDGDPSLLSAVDGDPDVVIAEGMSPTYPHYSGSYIVTPSTSVQTLDTSDKVMDDDVTVQAVQAGSATTPATIITANPTISVNSSNGQITASVQATQQITPTVVEGYVSTGTPGNVGASGMAIAALQTQGAQTIHPSASNQTIASGKYLTGTQTFKAVTVSGLTADKILQGTTVEIGDSDDSDRIMKVVGTAQGGITPTGTKNITANGTNIDVYNYQYADVAVPNSYSAGDEGKVVSNGALVAQTSDTVTQNGTVDTTLINSLTVNVSGSSGFSADAIADRSKITGDITLNEATSVMQYAFSDSNLTSIQSNTVTSLSNYAFSYARLLTSASFPNLTGSIGSYTFQYCSDLENVNLPKANAMGGYNFRNCTSLQEVMLPGLTNTGNSATGSDAFRGCTALKTVDIGKCVRIDGNAFNGDTVFDTLILRRTSICALSNVNAFTGTPFASGGTGGHIYIPKSLYDQLGTGTNDYKASTNWSTVNGYGTITWHKIEGSIYE